MTGSLEELLGAVSGRDLFRRFYEQAVRPLVSGVPHAAALLGEGSEVLGFDDGGSADHDFGPRVQPIGTAPGVGRPVMCAPDTPSQARAPAAFRGCRHKGGGTVVASSRYSELFGERSVR
jgi:hypothetical protein